VYHLLGRQRQLHPLAQVRGLECANVSDTEGRRDPVAILVPSVGVLARLGLSCYLGVPLAAVTMTGVANTSSSVVVSADDPINVRSGTCDLLTSNGAATRGIGTRRGLIRQRSVAGTGASLSSSHFVRDLADVVASSSTCFGDDGIPRRQRRLMCRVTC